MGGAAVSERLDSAAGRRRKAKGEEEGRGNRRGITRAKATQGSRA